MAKNKIKNPTYDTVKLCLVDVEDALLRFKGILPLAASYLGVEEHELYRYIQADHALAAAWQDSRRLLAAQAEGVLQGLLTNADDRIRLRAAEVVLRSQADERKTPVVQQIQVDGEEAKIKINQIFGV